MMRPMKLAGSELMFGAGSLEYLRSIPEKKVAIVTGGSSMKKNGTLKKIEDFLVDAGASSILIEGVEPDPSFETVLQGTKKMLAFEPDLIIGLGGGSAMDAAKAMWVYYEHPELSTLEEIMPPNPFPKLRQRARLCCIPSTSGTASEVSRSIVISDNETGLKHGLGNMEMMPDIAICDPEITLSMPPKITAETGMDALTHALEALVSTRANSIADVLAMRAVEDIFMYLPKSYHEGQNLEAREKMLLASMMAGMAFTNVSLGIVHSMAHTLGGLFSLSHGLADAILLPYVITYNKRDPRAAKIYAEIEKRLGLETVESAVIHMGKALGIPSNLKDLITNAAKYHDALDTMADMAANDGCTKTNPIIPSKADWIELFKLVYSGKETG